LHREDGSGLSRDGIDKALARAKKTAARAPVHQNLLIIMKSKPSAAKAATAGGEGIFQVPLVGRLLVKLVNILSFLERVLDSCDPHTRQSLNSDPYNS